jgi:hypothetical protein
MLIRSRTNNVNATVAPIPSHTGLTDLSSKFIGNPLLSEVAAVSRQKPIAGLIVSGKDVENGEHPATQAQYGLVGKPR